ncbi:nicotinate (nicotinamide) nucleotide adenylyltransferase [Isosphaera pallida ATCC 43644]|jgi:nicotinate-nucleotide adenylyltransferase|uniref:Probable nicotinate-nucleotide adenylyltransferase n=1 Tax=Isosphaera pallida (strain ATCC 43644 / DSM 9630 / IS1B) TaxID=575540 RepID=E8QZX4_ISOPI|nr:nicotinate-nucleotide adenylyltransferase [Isosphaera pallida]ADV63265.1 nicotinate (nicotinamide) nucleotide adenylyltransferase [Isosphaera pallida ATCC 43644]
MRLGVFGGTFDPIHLGHLILAEMARVECALDRVWFVPAGEPPHKLGEATATGRDRADMVRLAIAGHEQFELCDLDLKRPGPHFTVDLLDLIRERQPQADLFFLVGADSLLELPTWRQPEKLVRQAQLIVVNRPGLDLNPWESPAVRQLFADAGVAQPLSVTIPPIGLASRDLRADLARGKSIRYRVPRAVEMLIQERRLYQPSVPGAAPLPEAPGDLED